jgi:hypothetical protein
MDSARQGIGRISNPRSLVMASDDVANAIHQALGHGHQSLVHVEPDDDDPLI